MANRPTQEWIDEEIAALTLLQLCVRHYTAFGDDNRQAIAAQIVALEGLMDNEEVDVTFGEDALGDDFVEHEYDHALEAVRWLEGDAEEAPSEGWQCLVEVEA